MAINEGKMDITLATTIAPKGLEKQRAAIDSWIAAGFDVVSLNCPEEVEIIKPFFPEVEFVTVTRDARYRFGKPYVYLDDFFEYYKCSSHEFCSIINSDIYLTGVGEDLMNYLRQEAKGSLIYGSRTDIDSLEDLNGDFVISGFDYYFFDRNIIDSYPKEEFCLGQPFWDHWIIVAAIINGISVKHLINSIAYHVRHALNWKVETGLEFVRYTIGKYYEYLKKLKEDINENSDWTVFLQIIDENSDQIHYSFGMKSRGILVVYDKDGVNAEESETYASIKRQTYKYFRVVFDCADKIDYERIEEGYVYFISEGSILDKDFFKVMLASIKGKDGCISGVKLDYGRYGMPEIPATTELLTKVKSEPNNVFSDYIIYKKSFLQTQRHDNISKDISLAFSDTKLVEVGIQYHMKRILHKVGGGSLYIYGAGRHTMDLMKDYDFSSYILEGIIDGNIACKGTHINGYTVYHKGDIKGLQIGYILISSITYEKDIYDELTDIIDRSKIIRIYYN